MSQALVLASDGALRTQAMSSLEQLLPAPCSAWCAQMNLEAKLTTALAPSVVKINDEIGVTFYFSNMFFLTF